MVEEIGFDGQVVVWEIEVMGDVRCIVVGIGLQEYGCDVGGFDVFEQQVEVFFLLQWVGIVNVIEVDVYYLYCFVVLWFQDLGQFGGVGVVFQVVVVNVGKIICQLVFVVIQGYCDSYVQLVGDLLGVVVVVVIGLDYDLWWFVSDFFDECVIVFQIGVYL